jgi:hypothetical protein
MIERALAVDEESDSKTELESMTSPSMTNQSRRDQSPKRQQEEKLMKHRSLSLQYTTTTAESSSSRFDYV